MIRSEESSSSSRTLAALDVGTNTIRLLIGCVRENRIRRLIAERSVTRLGKELTATGSLNTLSIDNSIRTLKHFKLLCDDKGVDRIVAVGTSALREAGNSREFIDHAARTAGITVRVISGDEEAELTMAGIRAGGITGDDHAVFVLDIGGGSMEWVACSDPHQRGSLPLGCVHLTEEHIRHDPPLPNEIEAVKRTIEQVVSCSPLNMLLRSGRMRDEGRACVITGGTATALAAIDLELDQYDGDRVHGHRISFSGIVRIAAGLSSLPKEQRAAVRGLEPDRADVIIPGLIIVETIMTLGGIGEAVVSDYGLLEGLLMNAAGEEN